MVLSIYHVRLVQFFCDDAYISFRYAQNLAEGNGPVYNPGERVEGYTNFLWVVLLSAGLRAGASAEAASLVLGIVLLAITMILTWHTARRSLNGDPAWSCLPLFFLATLGPVVLWSVCGLETILFTAAGVAAFLTYHRSGGTTRGLFLAGTLYGVAYLSRPEGAIFGAVAGIHLILSSLVRKEPLGRLLRRGLALAAGFFIVFAPHLLWRISYYGDWLPNTFYVKTGSEERALLGLRYLRSFLEAYPAVSPLALLGLLLGISRPAYRDGRSIIAHSGLLLAVMFAYTGSVGGDYMALFRFHAPLLPFLALLMAVGLHGVTSMLSGLLRGNRIVPVVAAIVMACGLGAWFMEVSVASAAGEVRSNVVVPLKGMKINGIRWAAAGKVLGERLWPDAVLATSAAGAIPYYSGLPTIDQSGLNDRHTAKVEWDPWIPGKPGHAKTAKKSYILGRRPDVIIAHPKIWTQESIHRTDSPWPGYLLRTIPISGLQDEKGEDLWLYFWLRRDHSARARELGINPPEHIRTSF